MTADRPAALSAGSGRLARALLLVFVIEFGSYGAMLLGAIGRGESPWRPLLTALLIWVGIRTVATAWNFAQSEWHRSPRTAAETIGLAGALRLFLGELWTNLIVYSFQFPFERWQVPPLPSAQGRGQPIILVPGFCCNRGYFRRLRKRLEAAGHGPVYAVSLTPLFGSIDDNARQLGDALDWVCAQTGAEKAVLIGHSMGGLTIRALAHNLGRTERIAQIITLGTPNHGTELARGVNFLGEILRQMTTDSDWLRALNAHEQQAAPVPITAITTPHDDIVAPQHSSRLAEGHARNLILPGIGHLEMVHSRAVAAAILQVLDGT